MPAYDWTGAGGNENYFGAADYDRALRSNKTIAEIRSFIANNPGAIRSGSDAVANLVETINTGRLTSSLGQYQTDSGRTDSEGNPTGGLTDQAKTHFGGTDYLHAVAAGHGSEAISDYMKGSPMSIGAKSDLQFVHDDASSIRLERDEKQWRSDESEKARQRYENLMKQQREDAARAREQARIEGMKVKHRGSTSVGGGQSAMGIKFKQSPAYSSGAASRGTAQLARSDKGTQLKTLNV